MNRILEEDLLNIIEQPVSWEKLYGKNVMVTGASGMVGSYFVRTMLKLNETRDAGIHVVCVVRNTKKLGEDIVSDPNVEILSHDVTKSFDYEGHIDHIIHAASPASPLIMKDNPVETIAANVLGTYNTLELAREKNAEGYMFISSREIYGQPAEGQEFFTEDTYGFVDPLDPRSCYPEGKKAAAAAAKRIGGAMGQDTSGLALSASSFTAEMSHSLRVRISIIAHSERTYPTVSSPQCIENARNDSNLLASSTHVFMV